jgi:hypothetical protein
MYVSHNDLLWMLRQIYGQRIEQGKLIRKFSNHGIYSLFPYFDDIASIYEKSVPRKTIAQKILRATEARINLEIPCPDIYLANLSYRDLEKHFTQTIIQSLEEENHSTLEKGARVIVRLDSESSTIQPGSEGFIIEKLSGRSIVRFYSAAARRSSELFSTEIPDGKLQILTVKNLLDRHQDLYGIAQYFFNDSMLRSMRSHIDSSVNSFAAKTAVQFLIDEGYLKVEGDDFIGAAARIFSVLAPRLDAAYKDESLYSSHDLSVPPSERKPHVLRLELTTGCDYNNCTFCSEYSGMQPVTKSFSEFKVHIDRVVKAIGPEKSGVQRLFIGSGNSLGVDTELLRESLNYTRTIFSPRRISLYGRTASILEKSITDLKTLKDAGLSLVYWGLESGSDEVLRYICKDCTRDEMIEASKKLDEAGIEVSGMLMPGVGGLKFSEEHVAGTIDLLHQINLNYLTLLSINPSGNSPYAINMQAEPDNRPLSPEEINAQVYRLMEGINSAGLQIGMFTEEVDQASSNTMRFNYAVTASNKDLLLKEIRKNYLTQSRN